MLVLASLNSQKDTSELLISHSEQLTKKGSSSFESFKVETLVGLCSVVLQTCRCLVYSVGTSINSSHIYVLITLMSFLTLQVVLSATVEQFTCEFSMFYPS